MDTVSIGAATTPRRESQTCPGGEKSELTHVLGKSFGAACAAAGREHIRDLTISRLHIRLHFAGPALLPAIMPALEPLTRAIPDAMVPGTEHKLQTAIDGSYSHPALDIFLWDEASTGIPLPRLRITFSPSRLWPDAYTLEAGAGIAMQNADTGIASILGPGGSQAWYFVPALDALPVYERGEPLRQILHWALRPLGFQLAHAAAVAPPGAGPGVLIVGHSGSGKSSTALTCLLSGWRYVSDDHCLLDLEASPAEAEGGAPSSSGSNPPLAGSPQVPRLRAWSLYGSAKLGVEHLNRLPELHHTIDTHGEAGGDKSLMFVAAHFPEQAVRCAELGALLVPRLTGRSGTVVRPLSRAAGLLALAPSSLFHNPGAGGKDFANFAALLAHLPCYSLELGSDLASIPDAIAEVLSP
jgi:hypothetical protein